MALVGFLRWAGWWCGVVCLVGGVALVGADVVHAEPAVERISFSPRSDGQGFVVRIHSTERFLAYSAPRFTSTGQIELVLYNAALSAACQQDEPAGPIQSYTVHARDGHVYLHFLLDPTAQVDPSAYRDRKSNDLLLGLGYRGRVVAPPPVSVPSRPVAGGNGGLDDARERWKLDTIVIDAGHGGHDNGAVGSGGLREKDVVLAVALRVGQYLEEFLGVNVIYTRTDDRFISLRGRGRIANEGGAKLFLSIHANAAYNRSAIGTETFFLGMHKTDAAQRVMERENSVIQLESNPDEYSGLDDEALILKTLAQSAYMRQSEQLAELIQRQFTDRVGRTNRGVKQAGFYVLWNASMPSVLVELGFVTNPTEAKFLKSEDGQDYLASAIFRAVRAFKTQYEKGLDLVIRP